MEHLWIVGVVLIFILLWQARNRDTFMRCDICNSSMPDGYAAYADERWYCRKCAKQHGKFVWYDKDGVQHRKV